MLECIRQVGPASRAQIARASGVSKPTVSQALCRAREGAASCGRRAVPPAAKGPTAVLYELNPSAGHVVGIDVGREGVRAAVDGPGRHDRGQDRRADAPVQREGLDRAARHASPGTWRRMPGCGGAMSPSPCIGSPGVFSADGDHPTLAHNLPGWNRAGLLDAVRAELGTHVLFENDVNLGALGERRFGLGRERRGLRLSARRHGGRDGHRDRRPGLSRRERRGRRGGVSPAGHQRSARSRLPTAGPARIGDRRRVGRASPRETAGLAAIGPDRRAGHRRGTPRRRARPGRRPAELGARIGLALAAIVSVLDPALVILGGGIGRNGDLLLEPIQSRAGVAGARPPVRGGVAARRGCGTAGGGLDGARRCAGAIVRTERRRKVRSRYEAGPRWNPRTARLAYRRVTTSEREATMRRIMAVAAAMFAVVAAACSSGGDSSSSAVDTTHTRAGHAHDHRRVDRRRVRQVEGDLPGVHRGLPLGDGRARSAT